MASSGQVICKAANCLTSILLKDAVTISKVLTCYQPVRYRRRTNVPAPWFVPKETDEHDADLTTENEEFVQKMILDTYKNKLSPLRDEPFEKQEWTFKTRRTGVLAIKLGTLPQWLKDGRMITTTLLQVLDNHVIRYTPPDKFMQSQGWKPWWGDRFGSVVVGALSCDPQKFTRDYNNLFIGAGVPPKRMLTRFLVTPDAAIQPGTPLDVMHFRIGDFVDCSAKTVDYGFQGAMVRWGFKGMGYRSSVTKAHRKHGATGGGNDKAGVWPGKKMAGHMGGDWKTQKGLQIMRINTKYNVLYLKGKNIPGPNHCFVRIFDTVLRNKRRDIVASNEPPAMPTYTPQENDIIPEEFFHDQMFQFDDNSIFYTDDKKK